MANPAGVEDAIELKKRTGLVSVIPAGAIVCGWCAEFEDAARKTSEYARRLHDSERRNEMLHESIARVTRQLRENNCDELEELKRELQYARRGGRRYYGSLDPFCCPLCNWAPKDGAVRPLRSLRGHLRSKHSARASVQQSSTHDERAKGTS